jgi:hypothetical protein
VAADPNVPTRRRPVALAPLARPVFRALWIAALVSNVGYWMQSVGRSGRSAARAARPPRCALVQTAVSLPVVLLALPPGRPPTCSTAAGCC